MKRLLLAATTFAFAASGSVARADPIDFTYTGSVVDFTVPVTGAYQILAFGAQGGSGTCENGCTPAAIGAGGLGAEIGGDFTLTAGEILQIAVGGQGGNGLSPQCGSSGCNSATPGGGGGGSFIVGPGTIPLVIAGGGGGGGGMNINTPLPGQGGLICPDGGRSPFGNAGGMNGNGGFPGADSTPGGGGGGFRTPGDCNFCGGTWPGLAGGFIAIGYGAGGFGAGGSGQQGAGGGGGYSGGGGGDGGAQVPFLAGSGGGGGSFNAGLDQILMADIQSGNGEVEITELVPEPASSLAVLGSALIGLAVVWRRRRPGPLGYAEVDYRLSKTETCS